MAAAEGHRDRLSSLPDSVLIRIVSLLPNGKQVVRTSLLSSCGGLFGCRGNNEKDTLDYLASIRRELYYWRDLALSHCQLNPIGSVNWSSLVSLSIGDLEHTNGQMEQVLSGCPNLECLKLECVLGIHRLEISTVKLRELSVVNYDDDNDLWLEIIAPRIETLHLFGPFTEIRIDQRNVASLVNARLQGFESQKSPSYLKELLHSVAHVKNLELGSGCIECLSILELSGWRFPPSSREVLELSVAFEQLNFSGICSFLESSLDLETLVIKWDHESETELLSNFTNEDEQTRRFETHHFNGSFPHLKTIKFLNFYGSVLPLVKYLLKHAIVLEEFVITAAFLESDVSPDYDIMALEFLSLTRSILSAC
ncbi:putative F-box/LRR-repeat protein-like [Capsicum annuum]|nr:putative F-box/LRR-repeat protein-like [Capsicum annuum]